MTCKILKDNQTFNTTVHTYMSYLVSFGLLGQHDQNNALCSCLELVANLYPGSGEMDDCVTVFLSSTKCSRAAIGCILGCKLHNASPGLLMVNGFARVRFLEMHVLFSYR